MSLLRLSSLCADLVPYFMIHKLSQEPLNRGAEEEEEMKEVKKSTALKAYADNKCMQTGSSTEQESTEYYPIKEPLLHSDIVKNGMAGTHTQKKQCFSTLISCSDVQSM